MKDRLIELEQQYVAHTYARPPFVLTRGEGMMVYDSDGKAYLDFVAGIAVNSLGYGDPELKRAIEGVLDSGLLHVSNLYHTGPHAELAAMLCEKSFANRVYFCNSGAEANEGAIKFARKVAYVNGDNERSELVAFSGAFHGRTMGALALTPREKYQAPFRPLMPGAVIAEFNDLASAKAAIGPQTAAVIVEPVQGEGGIHPATPDFLRGLRQICDEQGALLIFDEIQCGVGRTGSLWAYEQYGVEPDIMTLAKPLAGGLPIGAVLMTEAVGSALEPGDHGSTFAASPLVTTAAKVVLARISQPGFLQHVRDMGTYLKERLEEINSPLIKQVRGRGLIAGMELTIPAAPLVTAGYQQGLLMINAGPDVMRFVPPLVVETPHVDSLVEKLTHILGDAAHV